MGHFLMIVGGQSMSFPAGNSKKGKGKHSLVIRVVISNGALESSSSTATYSRCFKWIPLGHTLLISCKIMFTVMYMKCN